MNAIETSRDRRNSFFCLSEWDPVPAGEPQRTERAKLSLALTHFMPDM